MKTIELPAEGLAKLLSEWKAISRTAFRDAAADDERGEMYAARAIRLKAFAYRNCAAELEKLIAGPAPLPTEAGAGTTTTLPPS